MPTVFSSLRQLAAQPLDTFALALAGIAFLATRYVVRCHTRVAPEGPLMYSLSRSDTGVPYVLRRLLGDVVAQFAMEAGSAHIQWRDLARAKCGGDERAVACLWNGPKYTLLLTHEADVRHVLLSSEVFVKANVTQMLEVLTGKNGVVTLVDEVEHARQFGLIQHVFASRHIRDIVDETARDEFNLLLQRLQKATESTRTGGPPVTLPIEEELGNAVLKATTRMALGTSHEAQVGHLKKFLHIPPSPLLVFGADFYNTLPIERNRLAKESRADLEAPIQSAFDAVRRSSSSAEAESAESVPAVSADSSQRSDASSVVCAEAASARSKLLVDLLAQNPEIRADEAFDQSITFVFAGYETTASAWNWAVYHLSHNLRVQVALFDALKERLPLGVVPTTDMVSDIPYLIATVRELLRVSPPIAAVIRTAACDTVLPGSGTYVPAGTDMCLGMYPLHHDPAVFGDDSGEFRPERWIEDPGLYDRVNGKSYIPFVVGKRACVGREMAYAELHIGLGMLVRNFELQWPEGVPRPTRKLTLAMHPSVPCFNAMRARTV